MQYYPVHAASQQTQPQQSSKAIAPLAYPLENSSQYHLPKSPKPAPDRFVAEELLFLPEYSLACGQSEFYPEQQTPYPFPTLPTATAPDPKDCKSETLQQKVKLSLSPHSWQLGQCKNEFHTTLPGAASDEIHTRAW